MGEPDSSLGLVHKHKGPINTQHREPNRPKFQKHAHFAAHNLLQRIQMDNQTHQTGTKGPHILRMLVVLMTAALGGSPNTCVLHDDVIVICILDCFPDKFSKTETQTIFQSHQLMWDSGAADIISKALI
jgi:hypothetical protein